MHRVDEIVAAALDRPKEDRPAYLEEACSGDPELRASVEALLEAHRRSAELFGAPVDAYASNLWGDFLDDVLTEEEAPAGEAGMRVGAYRLVRELGRGGMGAVFLAERADGQFEQEVAVKLIRRRKTGASVVRRFLAERQILATLRHPNIANLYDGGVTEETGLPYLVMEYVDGEPITAYAERNELSEDDRLQLFEGVCEAVQIAHGNLVVHRDLKPSNILVTEDGQVKLLDFGIAKLLEVEGSGESPLPTQAGAHVMTPAYAAPEQRRGETVTTATDVFQLGVLLQEILTCDRDATSGAGKQGDRETGRGGVREGERKLEGRTCHPELQSIVEKATQDAPSDRYRSVEALLADIRRYRERQPVQAHAGALPYRARKFVQRHRLSVAAAAVALVSLVGGLGAALWQAERATENARQAIDQQEKAEEVTAFLMGLFEANDPSVALGDTITARELLEQGVAHAEALESRPELQATLFGVTGRVFLQLDNPKKSEELYRRALAVWEDSGLDPQQVDDYDQILLELGYAMFDQRKYEEAETFYRRVVSRREAKGIRDELRRRALYAFFEVLHVLGHQAAAEDVFNAWEKAYEVAPQDTDVETAERMVEVAEIFGNQGEIRGDLDAIHRGQTQINYALATFREVYDSYHPTMGHALNLALKMWGQENLLQPLSPERLSWADSVSSEAVDLNRAIYTEPNVELVNSLLYRARVLRHLGRPEKSEAMALESIRMYDDLRNRTIPWTPGLNHLAYLSNDRGDHEEAADYLRQVHDYWVATFGEGYLYSLTSNLKVGKALVAAGRFERAERRLLTSYEMLEEQRGRSNHYTQDAIELLVNLYEAWGKPDEAAMYRAQLVEE